MARSGSGLEGVSEANARTRAIPCGGDALEIISWIVGSNAAKQAAGRSGDQGAQEEHDQRVNGHAGQREHLPVPEQSLLRPGEEEQQDRGADPRAQNGSRGGGQMSSSCNNENRSHDADRAEEQQRVQRLQQLPGSAHVMSKIERASQVNDAWSRRRRGHPERSEREHQGAPPFRPLPVSLRKGHGRGRQEDDARAVEREGNGKHQREEPGSLAGPDQPESEKQRSE
jgi:hypothetical protein